MLPVCHSSLGAADTFESVSHPTYGASCPSTEVTAELTNFRTLHYTRLREAFQTTVSTSLTDLGHRMARNKVRRQKRFTTEWIWKLWSFATCPSLLRASSRAWWARGGAAGAALPLICAGPAKKEFSAWESNPAHLRSETEKQVY